MKKAILFLLALSMIFSFASCDIATIEDDWDIDYSNDSSSSSTDPDEYGGNGDDTSTTWELGEFVDEFNRPTGNKYVSTTVSGTFSNSATTNSDLYASVQVTSSDIAIMLWEYGSYLVKGTYDTNNYSITVLDQNGAKHYLSGTMHKNGTRVYLSSSDREDLLSLLQTSGTLSFYLEFSKYSRSTYLFSVETDGFSSLYSELY